MRKLDIARRIHRETEISEEEWILEIFKTTLEKGEPIIVPGFGKFTVRSKLPRNGYNFKTGESIIIPARRVVTFRASSHLKTEVNAPGIEPQCSILDISR